MATMGYAVIQDRPSVYGGVDGIVQAVGSVAALRAAGYTIPADTSVNTATWAVVDSDHPNVFDVDGSGSWHLTRDVVGTLAWWPATTTEGEFLAITNSNRNYADAEAAADHFDTLVSWRELSYTAPAQVLIRLLEATPTSDRRLLFTNGSTVSLNNTTGQGNHGGYSYYSYEAGDQSSVFLQSKGDIWNQVGLRSLADQVAYDISRFKASVDQEANDLQVVLAREAMSPHTDSGHLWSDDLLHSLVKPNIRGLAVLLATAKASPTILGISQYQPRLESFVRVANEPGLLGLYEGADKAVWRALRAGAHAYGYDVVTGGIRVAGGSPVAFAVSYPTGETVATYDALGAVRSL